MPPQVRARRIALLLCWLVLLAYLGLLGWNAVQAASAGVSDGQQFARVILVLPGVNGTDALDLIVATIALLLLFGTVWATVTVRRRRRPAATNEPQPQLPAGFVPRVFISHSSADNTFGLDLARRLEAVLGGPGSVWYDRFGDPDTYLVSGLGGGDDWQRRIEFELVERNVFVVIVSPAAMTSRWVTLEIRTALAQAVPQDKVVIPILHRPTDDVPPFLSRFQYVSFLPSNPFEKAFAELQAAILLGKSRQVDVSAGSGLRLGPPFDLGQLPLLDHFVGREDAIAWTIERLTAGPSSTSGLASIAAANGLAGIGKSALAAAVLLRLFTQGEFPDGLAVVPCNDLDDPAEVLRRALERFTVLDKDAEGADLPKLASLAKATFEQKRALIVLDNVEATLKVEQVVGPLRAAGVALLLTSRAELSTAAVPHDATLELLLLPPEQARELFIQNYGQTTWKTLSAVEQAGVDGILTALGYHTLAVKLAAVYAARHRSRPLTALAAEYVKSPRRMLQLKDGSEAVSAVLDTSFAALPAGAQRLFTALACFATNEVGRNAVLALATAVDDATAEVSAEASLDALEDLRLVEPFVSDAMGTAGDYERLRLHPLLRAYAEERFATWPQADRDASFLVLATYYARYANATPDAVLAPDEANVTAVLDWAHKDAPASRRDALVADLVHGLRQFWRDRARTALSLRYLPIGLLAAEQLATASGEREDRLRAARLMLSYGEALLTTGKTQQAEAMYEASLTLRREVGDTRGEGVALALLGDILVRRGDLAGAQQNYEQYLRIMREVGATREEGVALALLGDILVQRGDLAGAQQNYEQYLRIMREVGDTQQEGVALSLLGDILVRRGDLAGAQQNYEQYLRIMREVGDTRGEGVALSKLGDILVQRGDLAGAQQNYEQYLRIMREVGDTQQEGVALALLGDILVRRGDLAGAQQNYEQYLRIMREVGDTRGEGVALSLLGDILVQRGDLAGAQQNYERSLAIRLEVQDRRGEGVILSKLGDILVQRGDLAGAQQNYEQALRIMREVGDTREEGVALSKLGDILVQRGDLAGAQQNYEQYLRIMREVGDTQQEGVALSLLGDILVQRGDLAGAQQNYEQYLRIMREVGDTQQEGVALALLGDILVRRGDLAGAQQNYEQYLRIMREVGATREEGVALSKLGDILVQRGDLAGAQQNYEQYLRIMREVGDTRGEGVALFKLGQLAEATDRLSDAENNYSAGLAALRAVEDRPQQAVTSRILGEFLITKRGKQDAGCTLLADAAQLYTEMGLEENAEDVRETARQLGCTA